MPSVGLPGGGEVKRLPRGPGPGGSKGFRGRTGQPKGSKSGSMAGLGQVAQDIHTKERTEDVVTGDSKDKTFADMMLSQPVLHGLRNAGFVQPSPVQVLAIPPARLGFDLIVQSKSGTGKTAVYVVAALEMVKADVLGVQCLVVAPTREIAVQGAGVATQIGANCPNLKVATFIGGISLNEDKVKARACHVAVGTPGRLKQLMTERYLNMESVRLVVMDEADKLLEPAFLQDTTDILNLLPRSKQVLALSATYPDQLATLAEKFMRSPQHIRPGKASQVLTGVSQLVLPVGYSPAPAKQSSLKQAALLNILSCVPYSQVLVFSNYSTLAQSTCDFLNGRGFPAVFMSSGQDQERRNQVIQTFKQFTCRILCSTDLTARGIDAENVNLVVNLEVPWDANTYLHRIGRGGRFGSLSLAVTLASRGEELNKLRKIVVKTDSVIKILPDEIPQSIRAVMANMEVLAAAEEEVEGDAKDDRGVPEKIIKKVHKKSSKVNIIEKVDVKRDKVDLTDEAIIRRSVVQTMEDGRTPLKHITISEVSTLMSRLSSGEKVTSPPCASDVPTEGEEALQRLGEAIERQAATARQTYHANMERGLARFKGLPTEQIMESLVVDEKKSVKTPVSESEGDVSPTLTDSKEQSEDDDSSEEALSDNERTSSDSTEVSDSDSSNDEEENDNVPGPGAVGVGVPQFASHYYGYPVQQAGPGYPTFPQFPGVSNPQHAPNNEAWYRQWAANLALQRQQIEWQRYWANLHRKS